MIWELAIFFLLKQMSQVWQQRSYFLLQLCHQLQTNKVNQLTLFLKDYKVQQLSYSYQTAV